MDSHKTRLERLSEIEGKIQKEGIFIYVLYDFLKRTYGFTDATTRDYINTLISRNRLLNGKLYKR